MNLRPQLTVLREHLANIKITINILLSSLIRNSAIMIVVSILHPFNRVAHGALSHIREIAMGWWVLKQSGGWVSAAKEPPLDDHKFG